MAANEMNKKNSVYFLIKGSRYMKLIDAKHHELAKFVYTNYGYDCISGGNVFKLLRNRGCEEKMVEHLMEDFKIPSDSKLHILKTEDIALRKELKKRREK